MYISLTLSGDLKSELVWYLNGSDPHCLTFTCGTAGCHRMTSPNLRTPTRVFHHKHLITLPLVLHHSKFVTQI